MQPPAGDSNIRNDEPSPDEMLTRIQALFLGIAGASLVIVVQLLTIDRLDVALTITVTALSISLPLMIFSVLFIHGALGVKRRKEEIQIPCFHMLIMQVPTFLGVVSFIVGIQAIWWHFSTAIGVASIAATIIAIYCFIVMQKYVGDAFS